MPEGGSIQETDASVSRKLSGSSGCRTRRGSGPGLFGIGLAPVVGGRVGLEPIFRVHRALGTPRARSGHAAPVFFVHRGLRPLKNAFQDVCAGLRLPSHWSSWANKKRRGQSARVRGGDRFSAFWPCPGASTRSAPPSNRRGAAGPAGMERGCPGGRCMDGTMMSRPKLHLASQPVDRDAQGLSRLADGDLDALGEEYDRHAAELLRFVRRSASREDAEDVVQSTFLRLAATAPRFDASLGSGRTWIYGVATHVLRERRRGWARLSNALPRLVVDSSSTAAHRRAVEASGSADIARAPFQQRFGNRRSFCHLRTPTPLGSPRAPRGPASAGATCIVARRLASVEPTPSAGGIVAAVRVHGRPVSASDSSNLEWQSEWQVEMVV